MASLHGRTEIPCALISLSSLNVLLEFPGCTCANNPWLPGMLLGCWLGCALPMLCMLGLLLFNGDYYYSHNLLYACIARRTAIVPENNDANDYTTPEQTKTFAARSATLQPCQLSRLPRRERWHQQHFRCNQVNNSGCDVLGIVKLP